MLKLTVLMAAAGLALAACASPTPPPVVKERAVFRDPKAQIWSNASFSTARLPGQWRQIGGFQKADTGSCQVQDLRISATSTGPYIQGNLCLNGEVHAISSPLRAVGPGRLALNDMPDWWVIWVDTDYRTMAIATPSGRFGFVLERQTPSADRWRAAKEVFDFNAYQVGLLRRF